MRLQPATPDMLAVLIDIVKAGNPNANVGSVRTDEPVFVLLRADLQNPVTPITRYCRVGITVWYAQDGYPRIDESFDLNLAVSELILHSDNPHILSAEWQSGPATTKDPLTSEPITYSTLLLEVTGL